MKKRSLLLPVLVMSMSWVYWVGAGYQTLSYLGKITPGGLDSGFANEVTQVDVFIGTNQISDPCNKVAQLISNRSTDVIINRTATIDCQSGIAVFIMKALLPGVSNLSIQVENKEFLVGYLSFFNKRPTGTFIRSQGQPAVFFVKGNNIYPIESPEAFNEFGFNWKQIVEVPQKEEFVYKQQNNPLEIWKTLIPEGGLITSQRYDGNPDIFIVNQYGYKRLFLNPIIFAFYGHLRNAFVRQVPPEIKNTYITPNFYKNCEKTSDQIYFLDITGEDTGRFDFYGSQSELGLQDSTILQKVFCINNQEFDWYPKTILSEAYSSLRSR